MTHNRRGWKNQLRAGIRDISEADAEILSQFGALNGGFAGEVRLPFLVTPFFWRRALAAGAPLLKQILPSRGELLVNDECELDDPLGEDLYSRAPRLTHQYKNRALLLSTGRCISYCRYCFRRRFTERGAGFITGAELSAVCDYLSARAEIEEILISGGDPLTAGDKELDELCARLREARPNVLLRICTRAPVFLPRRFTRSLMRILRRRRPLWLIPHINHPDELSPETIYALKKCLDAGIPIQSQSVLLRGVNDSVETLAALYNSLARIGVKPGYLFQCDLARGTAHFRVPIEEGLALYERLSARLSGLSLPIYAVDLPGGGGKARLAEREPVRLDERNRYYESPLNGKIYAYPRDLDR